MWAKGFLDLNGNGKIMHGISHQVEYYADKEVYNGSHVISKDVRSICKIFRCLLWMFILALMPKNQLLLYLSVWCLVIKKDILK